MLWAPAPTRTVWGNTLGLISDIATDIEDAMAKFARRFNLIEERIVSRPDLADGEIEPIMRRIGDAVENLAIAYGRAQSLEAEPEDAEGRRLLQTSP